MFSTTADTSFNSFQDPMNPAYLSGGFGIDPAYMTPSYAAPFRPQYQGGPGPGYNPRDPSMWQAARTVFNPFSAAPQSGSYDDNLYSSMNAFHSRPVDHVMSGAQNFAVPIAAMVAANYMTGFQVSRGAGVSHSMAKGWHQFFGKTEAEAARLAGRQGIFSMLGNRFGGGIARGAAAAFGFTGSGAATFAGTVGAATGMIAGFAAPLLAAQAITSFADTMVFDQYTTQRRLQSDLRDNFQHQFIGGTGGAFSRKGLSFSESGRMATQLNKFGAGSAFHSNQDVAQVSDMAARAGLLDGSNIDNMVGRIESITKAVFVLQKLGGVLEKSGAVKILSDLKNSGAGTNNLRGLVEGLTNNISLTGMSTDRFMDTIGAQSRYLAQANGLLPLAGLTMASSNASYLASAHRNGLINNQVWAMMGGIEGATQSSVTANINMSQVPYYKLMLMNRYLNGFNGNGSTASQIMHYGSSAATDPSNMAGAQFLYGDKLASADMLQNGGRTQLEMIMNIARDKHWLSKDGRLSQERAGLILKGMGMNSDQANAYLALIRSQTDPNQVRSMTGNIAGEALSNAVTLADAGSQNYGRFNDWAFGVSRAWRAGKNQGAEFSDGIRGGMDRMADSWHKWLGAARTGIGGPTNVRIRDFSSSIWSPSNVWNDSEGWYKDTGLLGDRELHSIGKLKDLFSNGLVGAAENNSVEARDILNETDPKKLKERLFKYLSTRKGYGDAIGSIDKFVDKVWSKADTKYSDIKMYLPTGSGNLTTDFWSSNDLSKIMYGTEKWSVGRQLGFNKNLLDLNRVLNDDGTVKEEYRDNYDSIMKVVQEVSRASGVDYKKDATAFRGFVSRAAINKGGVLDGAMLQAVGSQLGPDATKDQVNELIASMGDLAPLKSMADISDPEVRQQIMDSTASKAKQILEAQRMLKESKIDFGSYYEVQAGAQLTSAAELMTSAVNSFGSWVSALPGFKQPESKGAAPAATSGASPKSTQGTPMSLMDSFKAIGNYVTGK